MSFSGLSEREAEAARSKYGVNVRAYKGSFGNCLRMAFSSLTVRLLIISALLDAVLIMLGLLEFASPFDEYPRFFGTIAAAVLLTFIGAAVRHISGKALHEAFCRTARGNYTVFREMDKISEIPAERITVGEIIFLSEGDIVPADGIIVDGSVTVEQSALGLSGRIEKTAAPEGYRGSGANLKDQYGVYCGSAVCGGSASVRITAIGDETQIAKRSGEELPEFPEGSFSVLKRASAAVGIVSAVAAAVSCTVTGILLGEVLGGLLQGLSIAALALAALSAGGKALVCEMLGAASIRKLKHFGVSAIKPESLINAGKTEILMTERTGMITEGKYSVSAFVDGSGKEYPTFGDIGRNLGKLLQTAVTGSAGSGALSGVSVQEKADIDSAMLEHIKDKRKFDIPKKQAEASENGIYGVTVTAGSGLVTIIRGRYDTVLNRCEEYFDGNCIKRRITNKNALMKLSDAISLGGKDIVALAFSEKTVKAGKIPEEGFVLIGSMVLQDIYIEKSTETVNRLEKMGVRTILLTSGNRRNAAYTIKYADIKKSGGVVLGAEQLGKMDSSELAERLDKIGAAAEASGRDKLKLLAAAKFKGKKVCLAGSFPEDIHAISEADTSFASVSAPSSVSAACGAFAENGCGMTCAAEFISESRNFAKGYKLWIIFRTVAAVVLSVGMLFL